MKNKRRKILLVNNEKSNCGVYDFGLRFFDIISQSINYEIIYIECCSIDQIKDAINNYTPEAIIYNFHPGTLKFLYTKLVYKLYRNNTYITNIPQIGLMHEIYGDMAKNCKRSGQFLFSKYVNLTSRLFDYYFHFDETIDIKNNKVFKLLRPIYDSDNTIYNGEILKIGSFGFATPNKGFDKIIDIVQNNFDKATIQFHIPFATYGDNDGQQAKKLIDYCRSKINKSGIKLTVTHDMLTTKELIKFLQSNTINLFLYEGNSNRGISSVVDYAISSGVPFAISRDEMFRNVQKLCPNLVLTESNTIKHILDNENRDVKFLQSYFSQDKLLQNFDNCMNEII